MMSESDLSAFIDGMDAPSDGFNEAVDLYGHRGNLDPQAFVAIVAVYLRAGPLERQLIRLKHNPCISPSAPLRCP